jgi:FkbM family methyltransferase
MNLKKIHGHTIDLNLLNKGGYVLDLGCRDFVFTRELLDLGMKVISMDPYNGITIDEDLNNNPNFVFKNMACVGIKKSESLTYREYNDWGANSLMDIVKENKQYTELTKYDVKLTTIKEIMEEFNIDRFEVIKIDIEGSEYEMLQNLPKNCSKQLSVEFHDWLKLNPYKDDYEKFYEEVESNQLKNYTVVVKNKVPMHDGFTYSDTLYVLK